MSNSSLFRSQCVIYSLLNNLAKDVENAFPAKTSLALACGLGTHQHNASVVRGAIYVRKHLVEFACPILMKAV